MTFSPDGSGLAVVAENSLRLYNSNLAVREIQIPSGTALYQLAWKADGTQLTAGGSTTVRTWRSSDGAALRDIDLGQPYSSLRAFSTDAKRLALVRDAQLEVWNLETGAKLFSLPGENPEQLAFHPDLSKLVFSTSASCTLKVLNGANGTVAGSVPLEPADPVRTISLELQAQYLSDHSYSIAGTATVQGVPAYTVQGRGYMGSGQILKLTPPPLPQSVQMALLNQSGTTTWGSSPRMTGSTSV